MGDIINENIKSQNKYKNTYSFYFKIQSILLYQI